MQLLKEIVVAILTVYLAFTNFLATQIEQLFSGAPEAEQVTVTDYQQEPAPSNNFSNLPSRLGRAIPNILLKSADYQQAAIITGFDQTGATTNEPLDALVNIFCTFTTKDYVRTTTGTGFFIDPDGVIMTNAHVAQHLLLEGTDAFGDANCTVRTGNPAAPTYLAELLYLPPAWIQGNAAVINDEKPMGTGERDYALLYVSDTVDNKPLPARFPALSFDTNNLSLTVKGNSVVAAGYPATDFYKQGPSADLIPTKANTTISELYTFGSNLADVFSIKGSAVGVEGASGGPVLDADRSVIGVIVTRGEDSLDGNGSLRAITISHINRTIQEESGYDLSSNLAGDLSYRAEVFSSTLAPFLVNILEREKDIQN